MSNVDSSTESSLPPTQRILGSRLRSRKEKALFVQDGWDDLLGGWSKDGIYRTIRGQAKQRLRGSASMDSDESNATRHSSLILDPRRYEHRNPEAEPIGSTAPSSHFGVVSSHSTPNSSNTHRNSRSGSHLSSFLSTNASPAQLQRPPSPRKEINKFHAENPGLQVETHSSSMDRFLLQHDELAGFRRFTGEEWKRLRSLRAKKFRLRSRLQTKRKDLHEKQRAKSMADDAFMKYVRSNRSATINKATAPLSPFTPELDLDAYYEKMQAARDNYGEEENDYSSLEQDLDEVEYELAKLEGRFYGAHAPDTTPNPVSEAEPKEAGSITSSSPTSLLGISSDHEEQYHPFKFNYLSRLGDLDLAKERLHNIRLERDRLLSNQISRLRLGIELHENEKAFLADLPQQEREIQTEIAETEEDVERWEAKCLAEGININEDVTSSDGGSSAARSSNHKQNSASDSEFLGRSGTGQSLKTAPSYSMFSLLLPASIKGKATLGILITEFDENNKGNRISRWMLHKLRMSPLDADLLGRVFLHFLNGIKFQQWRMNLLQFQQDVLSLWETDEVREPTANLHTDLISILLPQPKRDRHGATEERITSKTTIDYQLPKSTIRRIRSAPSLNGARQSYAGNLYYLESCVTG